MPWYPRHRRRRQFPHNISQGRWSRTSGKKDQVCRWDGPPLEGEEKPFANQRPGVSILIVDDDAFGRETLGKILEIRGYHVQYAANGKDGLRFLNTPDRPGLVILDLCMPKLNGIVFLQQQMDHAFYSEIPIIIVSAMPTSGSQEDYPNVVARFEKPVPVEALLCSIRHHLRP